MKKFFAIMSAIICFSAVAMAQPRAIGVRIGYGAELSYQHTMGAQNFGELDLGWSPGTINGSFAYDFHVAPLGPLNFYAGPQVSLSLINLQSKAAFGMGVGAQLGLEYIFDRIPLQLSLDWKPTFVFIPATAFGWSSIALGIRYCF